MKLPPRRTVLIAVCLTSSALAGAAELRSLVYVPGLTAPLGFDQDPIDPAVQYVAEQGGRIRIVRSGVLQPTIFLDLSLAITSGGERGLLGLAFAPDYATSRRLFVNFTDLNGNTVVARFTVGSNGVATPASRLDLEWSSGLRYSSFGVDATGELHVLNYSLGTVVKIIMPPAPPTGVRFVRPGGDTQ